MQATVTTKQDTQVLSPPAKLQTSRTQQSSCPESSPVSQFLTFHLEAFQLLALSLSARSLSAPDLSAYQDSLLRHPAKTSNPDLLPRQPLNSKTLSLPK